MLGAVEFERDRLIDGNSHGFGRGVAVVANVDGDGLSLHACTSFNRAVIAYAGSAGSSTDRVSSFPDSKSAGTGIDIESPGSDFSIVRVRLRAAKPAPEANRITAPKRFAAAIPTK